MAATFSQILNMSMTGSVVILLVLLARLILKRAPKIFSYVLWSVVLFRLLCPVTFMAPISVLDVVEPEQKETSDNTSIVTYIPATVNTQADFIMVQPEEQVQAESLTEPEEEHLMTPIHAAALVWVAGMAGMMLYSVVQYLVLRRKLVGSVQLKGNIYLADHIDTAFVVGLLQPKIYLPSSVPSKERYFILAHEQHHIRRFDHGIKLLAYLALCLHWFNPLVWLAFALASRDMEMSCDEAVIKRLGPEIRGAYSASLLRLATHKKILSGMPLAFGEGDTKGRILNMAKWKKPKLWVSAVCCLACVIILICCAVNPDKADVGEPVFGERILSEDCEDLTQSEYTNYLREAYGLTHLEDHRVYHKNGIFQVDFLFSKDALAWQLESAQKFANDKFYARDPANYDLWEYDTWLIEHRFETTKQVHYRIFVNGDLINKGAYPEKITGMVTADSKLNIREEPTSLGAVVGQYSNGTIVTIQEMKDEWGLTDKGWIHMDYVTVGGDTSTDAAVPAEEKTPAADGAAIITDTELVQYGTLKMLLPSGFAATEAQGVVVLTKDSVAVGGIRHWNYPDFQPSDIVDLKKEESGAPIGYMSGSSAYGDTEYEIFWDGNPDGLCEQHTFFIDGEIIYDVWYDENQISDGIAERLLKTVAINAEPNPAFTAQELEALAKCKSVIDTVQSGSHYVVWEKSTTSSAGTSGYWVEYLSHDEDWMHITYLNAGKDKTETQYRMKVNGQMGYHVESPVKDSIKWNDGDIAEPDRPWLSRYQWDDTTVAYVDTLQDQGLETIMLRIDEPFYVYPVETQSYFVSFVFDSSGSFLRVELEAIVFRNNELWTSNETETIRSLDPEQVQLHIQSEYQNFNP